MLLLIMTFETQIHMKCVSALASRLEQNHDDPGTNEEILKCAVLDKTNIYFVLFDLLNLNIRDSKKKVPFCVTSH